ncbi:helix-turn-helix domain-containing protein [Pimelobacter simplex]|uniref:helix-turn-helix domain-containing protein n=2 Tax=Pimelobacter TaxID=2044 RepID=UPI0021501825|nr:helix-turn-helix transcriptional regulator [Pimelobacter simplex]UUW93014.1 helix-turn-helix domain-containing protein [Pimelobacter simplex]UUW99047.1 helix-turn-helix domain-containing protein [Pimelobacter simplex]
MNAVTTRYDLVAMHEMIDAAVLGHNIKTARRAAGLTQADVVGGDVSAAYLSRIESGERRPEFNLLERIAARLGVSTEQLLTGLDSERGAIAVRLAEVPYLLRTGELASAQQTLGAAGALLVGTGDTAVQGEVTFLQAATRLADGDVDGAIDELHAIVDAPANDPLAAWCTAAAPLLVDALLRAGRLGAAVETGEAALARLEAVGLAAAPEARMLATRLARVHLARRDYGAATTVARRAMPAASKRDLAVAYRDAAAKVLASGETHLAATYARSAAEVEAEATRARVRAEHLAVVGELLLVDEKAVPGFSAQETLATVLQTLIETEAMPARVEAVRALLARAAVAAGDDDAALEVLEGASHDALVDDVVRASCLVVRGEIDQRAGRLEAAVLNFDAAATALGDPDQVPVDERGAAAQVWYGLGALHDDRDDGDRARIAYRAAASLTARP